MHTIIIVAACLLLAALALIVKKAYFALPSYELKRRAASGDKYARAIYPATAYPALRGLLFALSTVLSALGLILFARSSNLVYALVLSVVWLWLIYSWLPNRGVSNFSKQLAKSLSPFFIWLFSWAYPLLKQFERLQNRYKETHTDLYENDDLRSFLRHQARQEDNRISARQLMRLSKLVSFEETTVGHLARSWKSSFRLTESDIVGPKLLDELHRSKQQAFIVTNHKNSRHAVGVLSRDALSLESQGRITDFMLKDVGYIRSDESVESALSYFSSHVSPLLVVLDKENEPVGTLSLADTLNALLDINGPLAKEEQAEEAENGAQTEPEEISEDGEPNNPEEAVEAA